MESKSCIKRWEEDGSAVIVDCGFLPSAAILIENSGGTNPNVYLWTYQWENVESLYSILCTGSTGVITRVTASASAMARYNSKQQGVYLPNPAGGEPNFRVPTEYSSSTDYSAGNARSATAAGDAIWPTSTNKNGFVYELATGTTTGNATEPTWGTVVGATTTDGSANVFTCRVQEVVTVGVQGLTIGASAQTDGQYSTLIAWQCLTDVNVGDVANLASTDYA